jgi:hypothetical protein
MSGEAAARADGALFDSDAEGGELLRLLAPHGSSGERLRIIDVPLPWNSRVLRQIANLDEDDLLIVRTWTPRTLQRILRLRGACAYVYVLAPSVDRARVGAPLLPRSVHGARRLRDVLVPISARLHARQIGGHSAEVVVLVTRSVPPGQWVASLTGLADRPTTVAATLSWRGRSGGATALVRVRGVPVRFVKIAFDEARAQRLRREQTSLAAAAASTEGVIAIPRARVLRENDGLTFLVEDAVDGRVAAGLRPFELEQVFVHLADWLITWHERTVEVMDAAEHVLELADRLDVDARYRSWLGEALAPFADQLPRVAVHGDLTMWNVLSTRTGSIAVVDWEDACAHGPLLGDLLYATVDAELMHGSHERRLQAFDAVFSAFPTTIGKIGRRAAGRLVLDAAVVSLAVHETWLRHAANEAVRGDGSDFQEIVHRRLAVDPERYQWVAGG